MMCVSILTLMSPNRQRSDGREIALRCGSCRPEESGEGRDPPGRRGPQRPSRALGIGQAVRYGFELVSSLVGPWIPSSGAGCLWRCRWRLPRW